LALRIETTSGADGMFETSVPRFIPTNAPANSRM
jgi:hypothetical protein